MCAMLKLISINIRRILKKKKHKSIIFNRAYISDTMKNIIVDENRKR